MNKRWFQTCACAQLIVLSLSPSLLTPGFPATHLGVELGLEEGPKLCGPLAVGLLVVGDGGLALVEPAVQVGKLVGRGDL